MGFAKEALVYKNLGKDLDAVHVIHADGDINTGEKCIIMEELQGVPCLAYMDSQYPLIPKTPVAPREGWVEETVEQLANIHAKFWNRESLLGHDFLHGGRWGGQEQRARWEASTKFVRSSWINADKQAFGISADVCRVLDEMWSHDSFEEYLQSATGRHFTLCHGDFGPQNVIDTANGVVVMDWEMARVGAGISDLTYFLMMFSVDFRRENWERLVELYVSTLAASGVDYPLEEAK